MDSYWIYCAGPGPHTPDDGILGQTNIPPEDQAEVWCEECRQLRMWVDAVEQFQDDGENCGVKWIRICFYVLPFLIVAILVALALIIR